jgi:branched-chain amino acid transport system permease protein
MGEPYTVTALIVITLGGFGSMSGRAGGRVAAGRDRGAGHAFHQSLAQGLLSYSVFIAVLLLRPNGLFAK